jgi:enamine deaminase RidA (YjgF/YER057c/UK114 family)
MAQGKVTYFNHPEETQPNAAFSQGISISGPVKTVYIGMQSAVDDEHRTVVGEGDIKAQTEQVLKNIDACLSAAGATREHIIMWTIWIKEGQAIQDAFAPAQPWLSGRSNPPANNVVFVSGFPNPAFLIGIEAIAIVPEGDS